MVSGAAVFDRSRLGNLVADKRFAEALDYLASLKFALDDSISREELADIFFTHAQCYYRVGDYRKAAIKLKCSIKIASSLNDNVLYARQKYTLGQIYRQMGRIDEALNEYTESYAFFRRVGDHSRMLAALEVMAVTHFQKGNLRQATELSDVILQKARVYKVKDSYVMTALNLCRVLLLTGDLKRVRELLSEVAEHCNDALNQVWLESLRGMLHVRLHEHDKAKTLLNRALSKAREMGYRREEVVCLEYLGLNAFYQGDYQRAIDIYRDILGQSQLTASAIAQTLWQLAEAYAAGREFALAEKTAAKAEVALTEVKELAEFGGLYRAEAILADKKGDADSARAYFGKSIETLTRHGACYELSMTHLAAGRADCFDSMAQREHLLIAKALFAKMNAPELTARADRFIEQWTAATEKSGVSLARIATRMAEPTIITQNQRMRELLAHAERIAASDSSVVLITGETGTGKDLLAEFIHLRSKRCKGPFCNENMAALSRTLAESELFGYEKGSYTGADRKKRGVIEIADKGTLCLNEIGEFPLELQATLLQVIETGRVRPIGSREPRQVDVRFIAITNRDLQNGMHEGSFRPDLYYRLCHADLHVPPLRERTDDLPLLLQYFLKTKGFGEISPEQADLLSRHCGVFDYSWPGNIRELEGVIERALYSTPSGSVAELTGCLKSLIKQLRTSNPPKDARTRVEMALERAGGNISAAARSLGIPEATLRYRLRRKSRR